jgi:serine/threonine-protein phosphatase 2B catalytic subunit
VVCVSFCIWQLLLIVMASDLLWSDPFDEKKDEDEEDGGHSHAGCGEPILWFSFNQTRQCSYVFGVNAVTQFLDNNNLVAVIRAHEAQFDGYRMHMKNEDGVPRVITIFSAPNYCDVIFYIVLSCLLTIA